MGIGLNVNTSWLVALDGQPLLQPTTLDDVIYLGPGQRADVIADITEDPGTTIALSLHDADEVYEIAYLKCDEKSKVELRGAPPPPLPPNDIASSVDLDDAMVVDLLMEGGAMGGLRDASLDGQLLGIRDLAARGYVWAFNGVAGLPDKPLFQAKRGQSVIVNIDNQNRWPHAMHIHGHHFQVHGGNGDEDALPWRDTALIDSGEMLKFVFVADNPGKWLLHCHMLEHQAAGMTTWFEVS
jgi:FtsP/CotA-like multicopper oxidase with cupredoxin domain